MDRVDAATRSRIMRAIKSKDTKPEISLVSSLASVGISPLPVPSWSSCKADIWLPGNIAVFVDGDFWHSCPLHGSAPEDKGWVEHLQNNINRDRRNERDLIRSGVVPIRVWECEVSRRSQGVAKELRLLVDAIEAGRTSVGDLAWTAGLFDGEGTISIQGSDVTGSSCGPLASVGMSHKDCLEHLPLMFGFGRITAWSSTRTNLFKWRTLGSRRVGVVCRWLKCFLRLKRPQAELVLAWCSTVQSDMARRPVLKSSIAERERILAGVRSLNSRGRGAEWREHLSLAALAAWRLKQTPANSQPTAPRLFQ